MPFQPAVAKADEKIELIRLLAILHLLSYDQLRKAEIVVPFFNQTLKAHISWTDWQIDLIFCMVPSYDLVYW